MYVTRPLSLLQKSAELVAAATDGPNSGYLVIQDAESGLHKNRTLPKLPFPQDRELTVQYTTSSGDADSSDDVVSLHPIFLVPLLNFPLSSNRYYAIVPHGKHKGEAFSCLRGEDKVSCCFCRCVKDVKPRPLDPRNMYQQLQIVPCAGGGGFVANSIAYDGFPPNFLRRKGWTICSKTPPSFKLGAAQGLDSQLRARLPKLDSPQPCLVGKWYTPFIFVKEYAVRDQVERSMYYEVSLEQRWEQIFRCGKSVGNSVVIDTRVEKEQVFVGGSRASWKEQKEVDGVVWYKVDGGGGVGLRVELVERMKWEQKRGGFMGGEEREVKINKVEEFEGGGDWNEFGCYVLVEAFSLWRLDGTLVMSHHFYHFHQLKIKWK